MITSLYCGYNFKIKYFEKEEEIVKLSQHYDQEKKLQGKWGRVQRKNVFNLS